MPSPLNQQVQRLASRLKDLNRDHPADDTLRDAVSLLSQIGATDSPAQWSAWQAIEADIQNLQQRGLWIPSPEDEELLEHLKTGFGDTGEYSSIVSVECRHPITTFTTAAESSNTTPPVVVQRPVSRYSFVTPPPLSAPLFPPTAGVTTVLPTGLIDILNYSYFLHLLVTDPGRVLPPGKSLLSVMAKPQSTRHEEMELPELKDKIQGVVHKAFWDEVRPHLRWLSVLMLLCQGD